MYCCAETPWYPYREGNACSSTSLGSRPPLALRTNPKSTCTNIGRGVSFGTLYSGGTVLSETRRYLGLVSSCVTNSQPYCAIWSSSALGMKQGVSETRKEIGVPQTVARESRNAWYFWGVKLRLNSSRNAGTMLMPRSGSGLSP